MATLTVTETDTLPPKPEVGDTAYCPGDWEALSDSAFAGHAK